jgi:hypothetical protein
MLVPRSFIRQSTINGYPWRPNIGERSWTFVSRCFVATALGNGIRPQSAPPGHQQSPLGLSPIYLGMSGVQAGGFGGPEAPQASSGGDLSDVSRYRGIEVSSLHKKPAITHLAYPGLALHLSSIMPRVFPDVKSSRFKFFRSRIHTHHLLPAHRLIN